ncbi:hypothetical protein DIX83_08200 [Streptococcus iniae]|uniref:discoidin domain-containing protein n=1 Tax=Streptococcus iniae TaxID=1346 RepID=UPI000EF76719|nr:discoidin domain-containing protein [Streptococcus iniae]RLU57935.1 hypothetical protein DIY03_08190 [Streptococcus iniae]RLU96975.1 hypothetical protein DIX83_08200 [Streptococcus iniae]
MKWLNSFLVATLLLQSVSLGVVGVQADEKTAFSEIEVHVTQKGVYNDQKMDSLTFRPLTEALSGQTVRIYPDNTRQEFLGLGGAMTESSAYNIAGLTEEQQNAIYQAYFSEEGAHYSLLRSSIGSADFSIKSYSYDDTESPDPNLEHFSIADDHDFVIPAIKRAQSYRSDLKLFAAPWAPPAWMKKSGVRRGQTGTAAVNLIDNSLKPEYYDSYAHYFVKYLQAYAKEGIPVYSISLQNEAQNNPKWEATTWNSAQAADFIGNYLGPALEKNNLDPKVLVWDWDKGNDSMHGEGFIKYNLSLLQNDKARKYIDGIAFHWYAGDIWHEIAGKPMWSRDFYSLDAVKAKYPDIDLYATEACQEKGAWFNSFDPADRYIYDILNDFEHGTKSWIDWNLVLDHSGGPTQGVSNPVHAPILLDEHKNIVFQPSYYILKRLSQEIQPGSVSIESYSDTAIEKTAVKQADGSCVVFLGNVSDLAKTVNLVEGNAFTQVRLEPHSLTSLKYKPLDTTPQEPSDPTRPVFEKTSKMKPVAATASSYEQNPIKNYEASSAIDESLDTRWASDWKDEESILFDLGESQYVNRLEFLFENNYNAKYSIWVSEDGQDFRQVSSISKNQFQTPNVNIDFPATKARYIKLQGEERANRYGYSIYNVLVTTLIERK